MKRKKMTRVFLFMLSLLMIFTTAVPSFAASPEQTPGEENEVQPQSSIVLPGEWEGSDYNFVSYETKSVSNVTDSTPRLTSGFTRANLVAKDAVCVFIGGKLTHTLGSNYTIRVGICYLKPLTGTAVPVYYCQPSSGVNFLEFLCYPSDLDANMTYYGYIKNLDTGGSLTGNITMYYEPD